MTRLAVALAILAVVAPLAKPGVPTEVIAQEPDPLGEYFDAIAARSGGHVERTGDTVTLTDAKGDVDGGNDRENVDILEAGYAWLPEGPGSMLPTWMPCSDMRVYCSDAGSDEARYANGWFVFWMELAAPVATSAQLRTEYGVVMRQRQYATAPLQAGSAFAGASHAFIGRNDRGATRDQLLFAYQNNAFTMFRTHARSRWDAMYVFVAIPMQAEVQTEIQGVDFYAYSSDGSPTGTRRDAIRGFAGTALPDYRMPPSYVFRPGIVGPPTATPTPSSSPTLSPSPAGSPAPVASPTPASSPAAGSTTSAGLPLSLFAIAGGLLLILLGGWVLVGRRRPLESRAGAAAPAGPSPGATAAGPGAASTPRPLATGTQTRPPPPSEPPPTEPTKPAPPPTEPTKPAPPPTPPTTPRPPQPPPVPPVSARLCPEDSEPRTLRVGIIEVELYLINSAQLEVEGFYLFGDEEVQDAIDGLESSLAGSKLAVDMLGAVTNPVGSILGTAHVPSFDTSTGAPQDAAMNALKDLKAKFSDKRRIGTWRLHVPRQQFRFLCRVTEECIGGHWVATGREFVAERLGPPTFVKSAPFELRHLSETDRAWYVMSRPFMDKNRVAEKEIDAAAKRCAG